MQKIWSTWHSNWPNQFINCHISNGPGIILRDQKEHIYGNYFEFSRVLEIRFACAYALTYDSYGRSNRPTVLPSSIVSETITSSRKMKEINL